MLNLKNIELHYTKEATELIGKLGFDPNYGVRPIKRAYRGWWRLK